MTFLFFCNLPRNLIIKFIKRPGYFFIMIKIKKQMIKFIMYV